MAGLIFAKQITKAESAMNLQIDFHLDYDLAPSVRPNLQGLLSNCFPDFFSDRHYYKQVPHGRLLARQHGRLVGQLGIDYRVVRFGNKVLSVFGVVDLCVALDARGRGIGGQLLDALEARARHGEVDLLIAIADDPRLYAAQGFQRVDPVTRWLAIEDRRSINVLEKKLKGRMLVKMVRKDDAPDNLFGAADLLGYLF